MGGYGPLKAHPFFDFITWENLHHQTPPKLTAYLPAMSEDDEDCYGNVSANLSGDRKVNQIPRNIDFLLPRVMRLDQLWCVYRISTAFVFAL